MAKNTTALVESFEFQTNIKKWGDNDVIVLPKELLDKLKINEGDILNVKLGNGRIIIESIDNVKHSNLKERLEAFYNKPIEEIYVENTPDADVDAPVDEEIW